MAAPKALRSPGSAGRPANVLPPVPKGQDIPDIGSGDLPDISGGDVIEAATLKATGGIPLSEQGAGEFGSTTQEAQAMAQSFVPSRETVADLGAAAALGIPSRVAGGLAGGAMGGPVGAYAGQMAAGAAAATFEKDLANAFRRALGAPENEERSRSLDVGLSLLFDSIGAGYLGGKAAVKGFEEFLGSSAARSLQELPLDAQPVALKLQESILKEFQQFDSPEFRKSAAETVAKIPSEFKRLMDLGFSPAQSAKTIIGQASFQYRARDAIEKFFKDVGQGPSAAAARAEGVPLLTPESFGQVITQPQKILDLKEQRADRILDLAFETVRQTRGLKNVDTSRISAELEKALTAARDVGDEDLAKQIENVRAAITDKNKLQTISNDLGAFNENVPNVKQEIVDVKTGKKYVVKESTQQGFQAEALPGFSVLPESPNFSTITYEVQPGMVVPEKPSLQPLVPGKPAESLGETKVSVVRVPQEQTQLGISFPGRSELKTEEIISPISYVEQQGLPIREVVPDPARFLPSKITNANDNAVMLSIESLIRKRRYIDKLAKNINNPEKKAAMEAAAGQLRNVEDAFMQSLVDQGGRFAEIGEKYMTAKQSYSSLKQSIETMRNLAQEDAAGLVRALETTTIPQLKAWTEQMPQDVKDVVGMRYLEGILNLRPGMPEVPFTPEQVNKVAGSLLDPKREKQLGLLFGSQAAQQIKQDLGNIARLMKGATAQGQPIGGPERQIVRKLFLDLERLTKKWGLNMLYSGRMALPPESRAYEYFLDYMLSKDFSSSMKSLASNPAGLPEAGTELVRVFGRNHPHTSKFYQYIQDNGLLPYAASAAGQTYRATSQQPEPGMMQ